MTDDPPYLPRAVDKELRYTVPVPGEHDYEFTIAVAMRGASFLEPFSNTDLLAPLFWWFYELLVLLYGRRSPVRKVGIVYQRTIWSRAQVKYKVWVPSLEEADELVQELYDELVRGVRRWD